MIADDLQQCGPQRFQTVEGAIGPDRDNNVAVIGKSAAIAAKSLSNQPLDSVAPYRVANFSLDTDSQTIPRKVVCPHNNGKSVAAKSFPPTIDVLKLPIGSKQMLFGEGVPMQSIQAASCVRPLARRLLMTARPFLVLMRRRNPWVRARLVLLG